MIHTDSSFTFSKLRARIRRIVSRLDGGVRSDTRGVAIVEFAVAMPIVLLLMTGIFTFSIALWQKLTLAEAVSVGGRVIAVDCGDTDPCKTAASAIYAAAPGLSSSNVTLTFVLNGTSTGATCPGSAGGPNTNLVTGGTAQVVASYPCTLQIYGIPKRSCTLSSQITELVQ